MRRARRQPSGFLLIPDIKGFVALGRKIHLSIMHATAFSHDQDQRATLTGHASPFPGLGKTVSTGFGTGLVRRSARRYLSATPRGWLMHLLCPKAQLSRLTHSLVPGHPIIYRTRTCRISRILYESSVVPGRFRGATRSRFCILVQNLMAGAGSSSQFIGGLMVALLYVVIGLLGAIGSILIFRQIFQGRWEQIFWTSFLVVIAAFYLSFAAYFEASTHAWQTEVVGVAVFLVCAVGGLFLRSAIAVGYVIHGLWDLSVSIFPALHFAGLSITEIPLGYGIFCSTYDFVVACYLMTSDTAWHKSGKFDLYFWRHRP